MKGTRPSKFAALTDAVYVDARHRIPAASLNDAFCCHVQDDSKLALKLVTESLWKNSPAWVNEADISDLDLAVSEIARMTPCKITPPNELDQTS